MSACGTSQVKMLEQLLDDAGLGPRMNPGKFDMWQRRLAVHWAGGGSIHQFARQVIAEEQAARSLPGVATDPASYGIGPLTWQQARRALEHRYPSP